MKIIKVKDYEEMSHVCADIFLKAISENPSITLGLATGGTPERAYEIMIEANKKGMVDFSEVSTYNLDEYIGIKEDHEMSYHTFMDKNLFSKVNINKENTHVPSGEGDVEANAKAYDEAIEKHGGIDIQLLGIGENAHIAFNEPGSSFTAGTSIVNLTESTINANSRYFDSANDVPKTAITMGIGTIMKAKKIVLIASGPKKAKAIFDTVNGLVSEDVPSSILQKHLDVTIIVDEAAAAKLSDDEDHFA